MSEEELEMLEMTINADKVFDVNFHNISKELLKAYKDLQVELKSANEEITWWSNRFNAVERDNRQLKEDKRKAIDYINKRMVHEGEYYIRKAYHFRNTEYGKDLLQILGDKENESR